MRTHLLRAALAATVALSIAACGSASAGPSTSGSGSASAAAGVEIEGVGTVSADAALAATVPAAVAGAGQISVATNAPYEPFIAFKSEGVTDQFTGLDYDLVTAIAARLGIKAPFQQQPFDGLVPGLKAGKYDAIVGGITDNKERQATATFVDYSASGTGILVAAGNPQAIKDLSSLCGQSVAVQKAAKQVELLADYSTASCSGNAIKVTEYPQNTDAFNALLAGKAVAFVATKVNLVDIAAKTPGKSEVVDDPANPNGYEASPNGIGFLKDQSELAAAFQAGLQSLMDDGTYAKIFEKWGQAPIAIDKATIDAAID